MGIQQVVLRVWPGFIDVPVIEFPWRNTESIGDTLCFSNSGYTLILGTADPAAEAGNFFIGGAIIVVI